MTVMHLMWWPAWVCKWSIFSWSTTLQIVQPNGVSFLHQRHNARSCNDWLWRESRRSGHGFGCVGFCMQWIWWLSSPKRENSTEELNENNFPFQFHTVKRNKDQPVLYLLPLYYTCKILCAQFPLFRERAENIARSKNYRFFQKILLFPLGLAKAQW